METLSEIIISNASRTKVSKPGDANPRLKKLNGIKAVVFDVYGTLFSSSAGDISLVSKANKDQLIRSVLQDHCIEILKREDECNIHSMFIEKIEAHQAARKKDGINYPEVDIRLVWRDLLNDLTEKKITRVHNAPNIERLAIYFECLVNPVQEMPELGKCLQLIHDRSLLMSIISNAQFYTPYLFNAFLGKPVEELGFCTASSVWSYQLLEAKPSIRLYEVAAGSLKKNYQIESHQVLYVGNDIRNDIWPAGEAGFNTALFAGDVLSLRRRSDDPDCSHIVPDIEITELMQLIQCLD